MAAACPWGRPAAPAQASAPAPAQTRLADIMREQQRQQQEPGAPPGDCTGDYLDDEALAALLMSMELNHAEAQAAGAVVPSPSRSREEEDRQLAQLLQEVEAAEYIDALGAGRAPPQSRHESVRVLSVAQVLCPDDPTACAPVRSVRSSAWAEAQALDRKAALRQAGVHDAHNDVSSFSRHEPLLRALRSSELVSELDGGGDVAGSGLLVDRQVAQELRAFTKKQHKHQRDRQREAHSRPGKLRTAGAKAAPTQPASIVADDPSAP